MKPRVVFFRGFEAFRVSVDKIFVSPLLRDGSQSVFPDS